MEKHIRITLLVENTAGGAGTLGEHGLSYFIETPELTLLFDTGQGFTIRHNADRLGLALDSIQAVVLSHGHYDHTGGLPEVINKAGTVRLYLHPEATKERYSLHPGRTPRSIGMSQEIRSYVQTLPCSFIESFSSISERVHLSGPIPRITDFEDTGGPFFLGPRDNDEPDLLPDDQALCIQSAEGLIVLLGCSHAGIINTLYFIRDQFPGYPFRAVIGGMHLLNASPERLNRTLAALDSLSIEQMSPLHCTGLSATVALWNRFPGRCVPFPLGTRLEFAL